MSGEVTATQASGIFKKVYAGIEELRPESAVLQKRIDFDGEKLLGESYNVSVALRPPQGFTYAGADGGVVALNAPKNMLIKQATLKGYEIDLREQIAWKALASAIDTGEAAFKNLTAEIVLGMKLAMINRIEASLLHGQRGYGTIESVGAAVGQTSELVITSLTYAPGMFWLLGEGSTWDSWTSFTGVGTGTKNNGSGAISLNTVTVENHSINVTFVGTLASEITAGDILFPQGAYDGTTFTDMPGLLLQAENATGTSLGLSAVTYPNWSGNTYAINGPPGHGAIEKGLSRIRDRGCSGGITLYCGGLAYSQLIAEIAAVRNLDASYTSDMAKQGMKAIKYFSPQIGDVEVVYLPCMKWGELLALPTDSVKRVGATDVTFELPGVKERFFRYVEGYNACELMCMTDQAPFLKKPGHAMVFTGLTYA